MRVGAAWADSLAYAETLRLGRFVVCWGVERWKDPKRAPARSYSGAEGRTSWPGWSVEDGGETARRAGADTTFVATSGWCCACRRGRACADPGKHPRPIERANDVQMHGSRDARSAVELLGMIERLRYRPINLGLVPAEDIVVLDIDPRNGGLATLRSLEARSGPLPATLAVYTGGGGEHRYWRATPGLPRRSSIGPGLDIKTTSGLLIAPPSVHVTGRRYVWNRRRRSPADAENGDPWPAHIPAWLDHLTMREANVPRGAGQPRGQPVGDRGALVREMAATGHGGRAHALFRLACWALESGEDLAPLLDAARGTGLAEHEIRRQVSGAKRAVRR